MFELCQEQKKPESLERYLRTKDGKIIDLMRYGKGEERNGVIEYPNRANKGSYLRISKDNFHKESNNIDELLDEYVIIYDNDNTPYLSTYTSVLPLALNYANGREKVYGAVWTKGEKGEPILKSVAILDTKAKNFKLLKN